MPTLKPLGNKLLVRREDAETQTESGIHIPLSAEEKKYFGTVLAVGPDVTDIEEGDEVMFGKYDGTDFDAEEFGYDGEVIFLFEEDIICVVEEN